MPPDAVGSKLFGATRKLAPTGDHEPDKSALEKPFSDPEAKVRLFCRGCGQITEVNQPGVNGLAQDFYLVLPENFSGRYLAADRCLFCADAFQGVSVQTL